MTADRQQAESWCRQIWGGRFGFAITALGLYPDVVNGRYRHRTFRHLPFEWPAQVEELLDALLPRSAHADVYVAPLLRDAPNRRQGHSQPLSGRHLWLDADGWDTEQEQLLAELGVPVVRVQSGGGPGRWHLYPDLGHELPGAGLAAAAKELAARCGADRHGGDNKLLRLPGTLNHKPRLVGLEPGAVRLLP